MYLSKTHNTPKGATTTWHVVRKVEGHLANEAIDVYVQHFADQAAYAASPDDPLWTTPLSMPLTEIAAPFLDSVLDWLTTDAASPFLGASIIATDVTLEAARTRKWAEMKLARDAAEFGGFTWNDGTNDHAFDSDPMSQSRIQGASLMALLAAQAQQAFTIDWTKADNTVVALDGDDMIAVGLALGTHVGTQHAIGRTVRAAIEAAATVEAVEAIVWP